MNKPEYLISAAAGIIFAIGFMTGSGMQKVSYEDAYNGAQLSQVRLLIKQCELTLPRNQKCVAISVVAPEDVVENTRSALIKTDSIRVPVAK